MLGLGGVATSAQPYGFTGANSALGNVSVHNSSLDTVTNDVPSVLVCPCTHDKISPSNLQNNFLPSDLVFTLNERALPRAGKGTTQRYSEHRERHGGASVPLVTVPMLNNLLRETAVAAKATATAMGDLNEDQKWWTDPAQVAAWAKPMGAVLNTVRGGGGSAYSKHQKASYVNVQVSRRSVLKNNFFTASGHPDGGWHAQSMDKLVVHYSTEMCGQSDDVSTSLPVVMVSLLVMDANLDSLPNRNQSVEVTQTVGRLRVPNTASVPLFAQKPTKENSVIVEIGRVLHSPPHAPTAGEALRSCYDKAVYDKLKPIEVELGCP